MQYFITHTGNTITHSYNYIMVLNHLSSVKLRRVSSHRPLLLSLTVLVLICDVSFSAQGLNSLCVHTYTANKADSDHYYSMLLNARCRY